MIKKYINKLKTDREVFLRIKAKPGAAKTRITETMSDGTLKIEVAAPGHENKANQALLRYLADKFNVPGDKINIITGKTSRYKLIKIKI